MNKNYTLIFDHVILKQMKKFDKIELLGGNAGNLLDSRLHIYEMKNIRPPIRLYFKIVEPKKEAYLFEYEIKTSKEKQTKTIAKIKRKALSLKS